MGEEGQSEKGVQSSFDLDNVYEATPVKKPRSAPRRKVEQGVTLPLAPVEQAKQENRFPLTPEVPPAAIDVIANKEEFLRRFQFFRDRDTRMKESDARRQKRRMTVEDLLPLWGELTPRDVRELEKEIHSLKNISTLTRGAFRGREDFLLQNSAVLEDDAFILGRRNTLDNVLLLSDNAFKGGHELQQRGHPNDVAQDISGYNTVAYGKDLGKYLKRGTFINTILGGIGALSKAQDVHLINSYLVTPHGTYYFDDYECPGYFRIDEKYRIKE